MFDKRSVREREGFVLILVREIVLFCVYFDEVSGCNNAYELVF